MRRGTRLVAGLLVCAVLSGCGSWRGIANVPLPGGPAADHPMTVYVEVPDTLGLTVNSRVRVADVYVGSVRSIALRDWIATLTVDLRPTVNLPANAIAKIGQTSLLGSQHLELHPPADPVAQRLAAGDVIGVQRSTSYPTTERTLAGVAAVLRGGGISSLDVISTEVDAILGGHAGQIREFLGRLDTFTAELSAQSDGITDAIEATRTLVRVAAHNNSTLDATLREFPPLIAILAENRTDVADSLAALGRLSAVTGGTLDAARSDIDADIEAMQRPFKQLAAASPFTLGAMKLMLTLPFNVDIVDKVVRGDYANISPTIDLTLSALDNAFLSGTRFSGALRALEQAWGRDPATMVPDVRFTPNPLTAPGGPLIERAE